MNERAHSQRHRVAYEDEDDRHPMPPPPRGAWLLPGIAAALFVVLLLAWAWLKFSA